MTGYHLRKARSFHPIPRILPIVDYAIGSKYL